MGSNTKGRKPNDRPLIRIPRIALSSETNGGGVRRNAVSSVCVASFDVKVKQHYLIKPEITVYLSKHGEGYKVMIAGNVVGTLSARHSKMVSYCSGMGITYTGRIVNQKKGHYARFIRTA